MVGGFNRLLCPGCVGDQRMLVVMLLGTCQSLRALLSLPSSLSLFSVFIFFFFRWYLHFISPTVPIRFLDICSGGSRAWEISPPGACISMSPGGRPLAIYCVPFGAVTGNTPAISHPFKFQYLLAVGWLGRLPLRSRVAAR